MTVESLPAIGATNRSNSVQIKGGPKVAEPFTF
jgi:hypothetical protein